MMKQYQYDWTILSQDKLVHCRQFVSTAGKSVMNLVKLWSLVRKYRKMSEMQSIKLRTENTLRGVRENSELNWRQDVTFAMQFAALSSFVKCPLWSGKCCVQNTCGRQCAREEFLFYIEKNSFPLPSCVVISLCKIHQILYYLEWRLTGLRL